MDTTQRTPEATRVTLRCPFCVKLDEVVLGFDPAQVKDLAGKVA